MNPVKQAVSLLISLLLTPLALFAQDEPNVLLIMADDFRDFGGAFTKDVVVITRESDGQTELYAHDSVPEELYDVSAPHSGVIAELTAKLQKAPPLNSIE